MAIIRSSDKRFLKPWPPDVPPPALKQMFSSRLKPKTITKFPLAIKRGPGVSLTTHKDVHIADLNPPKPKVKGKTK